MCRNCKTSHVLRQSTLLSKGTKVFGALFRPLSTFNRVIN